MMPTMNAFKFWNSLAAATLLAVTTAGCGDVVRQGRAPVFLVIDQLTAQRGAVTPEEFSGYLHSDVVTNVTTPAPCAPESPCPTIFPDAGQVILRVVPKDITTEGLATAPSTNSDVTITRYRVDYRRTDGRNTPGVDVPYGFDGGVTGTVPHDGSITMVFELVRHVSKMESPLVQLASNGIIVSTIADVTFYGQDLVGNEVSARGSVQVDFGNFGDQ
jgi:hypothetical protein